VAVHAIGDRAVDEVIEVFEGVLTSTSSSSSSSRRTTQGSSSGSSSGSRVQHRIEHVQHMSSPQAAAKMAALGLAAVPNPQHLLTDRPMLLSKLGFNRSGPGRVFAFKTLADAGVGLGFGSDWPVVEIEPWTSVFAAVHRTDPPGNGGSGRHSETEVAAGSSSGSSSSSSGRVWESEDERLTLSDVLLGHTLHAARVARLDHVVGRLAAGMKADFIVLYRSPFACSSSSSIGGPACAGNTAAGAAVAGDSGLGGGGVAGGSRAAQQQQQQGLEAGLPVVQRTYSDGVCVFGCDGSDAAAAEAAQTDGVLPTM
jgi:predicted amidohydrolase YtcJ